MLTKVVKSVSRFSFEKLLNVPRLYAFKTYLYITFTVQYDYKTHQNCTQEAP